MTDKIFDQLHHICIVVENLDRAVAFYESIGIGPWRDFPSLEAFRGELEAPDVDDFMKLHYRFASLGNVQLQLCAAPAREHVTTQVPRRARRGCVPPRFHRVRLRRREEQARSLGLAPKLRGRLPNRNGFTYFDTDDRGAGVTLQIRKSSA